MNHETHQEIEVMCFPEVLEFSVDEWCIPCSKKLLQLWNKALDSQSVARLHFEAWNLPAGIKGSLQEVFF